MERRNFAALCAAVLCFWLFALAFGTAQGMGLHLVARREAKTASAQAVWVEPALPAAAAPALSLNCRAAILIEQDSGRVLYEKNAEEKMPIASITKVMTLLLTFEAIHGGRLTLDTLVPVSEHAYHMGGSQIWLEPGEQFTLDEMLRAICVSSANDAAVAVAELVGGSEPAFVEQMNARAAQLGMEQTTFRNACGLDTEGHLSTARDVAIMSREILTHLPGGAALLPASGRTASATGRPSSSTPTSCSSGTAASPGSRPAPPAGQGSASRPAPPGMGSSSSPLFWGHPAAPTASTPPRRFWTTVLGPMRPRRCPHCPASRCSWRSKAAPRGASRWITAPCPRRCLLEKGAGAALRGELTLPAALEAPVERGQAVGKVSVYQGENLLSEYEVRAAVDAAKLTLPDALYLLWESLTVVF